MAPFSEWLDDADEDPRITREVEIDAPPADVWEALATEEGRERWLEPDPERELHVELTDEPHRIVWWWWHENEPPRRVELLVVAVPSGTRVIVVESAPSFPLAQPAAASFPLAQRAAASFPLAQRAAPSFPLAQLAAAFTSAFSGVLVPA